MIPGVSAKALELTFPSIYLFIFWYLGAGEKSVAPRNWTE